MSQLFNLELLAGLALALTWGGMTFFSAVMAPLVFTKLPFESASAFIREVFPWYYLTMGASTLVALLTLLPIQSGPIALKADSGHPLDEIPWPDPLTSPRSRHPYRLWSVSQAGICAGGAEKRAFLPRPNPLKV